MQRWQAIKRIPESLRDGFSLWHVLKRAIVYGDSPIADKYYLALFKSLDEYVEEHHRR